MLQQLSRAATSLRRSLQVTPALSRRRFVRPQPLLSEQCRLFSAGDGGGQSSSSATQPAAPGSSRTYYDILEIPPKAKKEEIKDAYRKLAKRYHPDRNVDDPEAEARFKEVQEAHATLSDSWKRALYDQDLQFSKFGTAATQEVDREKWTEHWSKETPEEYEKRKERYRRYAAGERPDLPPDRFYIQWNIPLSIVAVGGIFYICVKAPDWLDAQSEPHFCDPMHDDTSVPLVRAFHNPVQNRWERLPEGSEPPTPRQLYAYYQKAKPELMEGLDIRILPKVSLTVLQVPRTSAVKSPLLSALAPAA